MTLFPIEHVSRFNYIFNIQNLLGFNLRLGSVLLAFYIGQQMSDSSKFLKLAYEQARGARGEPVGGLSKIS